MFFSKHHHFLASKNQQPPREPQPLPGHESLRLSSKSGELTELERRNLYFVEILQSIAHSKQIIVSNDIFAPKEFLYARLELSIMKCLVQYAKPEKSTVPRRPSDVYNHLMSLMATIQRVDDCGRGF
jgi:hypothetical protein